MPPSDSVDQTDIIHRKSVTRYLLITVLPATIVFVAAIVWAAFAGPRLPNDMAVHFGVSGDANGFSSLPVFLTTLTVSFILVAGLLTLGAVNGVASGWAGRLQGAVTTAILMMLAALVPALLIPQVHLTTATDVVLPSWSLLVISGLSACGFVLGAIAPPVPAQSNQSKENESTVDVHLAPNERAVWFGVGQVNTAVALVVWATMLTVAVLVFVTAPSTGTGIQLSPWALISGFVAVILVAALLYSVHVRVDSRGVHWKYFLGLPRGSISFADLEDAEVADIRPGEWGGWGWRVGPLGTGLIVRGGEGIRLQRSGKKDLYITVDDAQSGVALIKALQRRNTQSSQI